MNNQSYVISSLAGNMAVQISNLNIQLAQEQAKNKELTRSEERRVGKECRTRWDS